MAMMSPRERVVPANYGKGEVTLSAAQLLQCDPGEMTRKLVLTFRSEGYAPPMLPKVAGEVMALAGRPDTTFPQVAECLKQDPMLAGRVMQTAQSALYAGRVKPRNLDDAISRMGIKGLMNLVLEVSLSMKVFRSAHYTDVLESVRKHSLAVAHIARKIAPQLRVDPNLAFTAGLLHDVGIAGGLLVIGERIRGAAPPKLESFWFAIEAAHIEGSNALCKIWGIPTQVRLAVAAHHDPRIQKRFHGPSSVVCLANHLANVVGAGVDAPETDFPVPWAQSESLDERLLAGLLKAWRLSEAKLAKLEAQAQEIVERVT